MKKGRNKIIQKFIALGLCVCLVASDVIPVYRAYAINDLTVSSQTTVDPGQAEPVTDGDTVTVDQSGSSSSSEYTDEEQQDEDQSNSVPSNGSDASSTSSQGSSEQEADSSNSGNSGESSSQEESSASGDSTDNSQDSSSGSSSDSQSGSDSDSDSEQSSDDEQLDENEEVQEFESLFVLPNEEYEFIRQVDEEVTLEALLSRSDVQVTYQWQRMQKAAEGVQRAQRLYDYAEGSPTSYSFAYSDTTESAYLAENPDATFPGIEMYYAVKDALDTIGEDTSTLSLAWRTPNLVLDGYAISAVNENGTVKIYADKDGQRYTAVKNSEGKFAFESSPSEVTYTWQDIPGANESTYTFTVNENDYNADFRCVVTIVDEEYKQACLEILESQGSAPSEEQINADQLLYTPSFTVKGDTEEEITSDESDLFLAMYAQLGGASVLAGEPALSDDHQWITGLNGYYEYITKDTYDRVTQWLKEGKITQTQADRYWTGLLPFGFGGRRQANVLDENGFPVGGDETYRAYNGFDLTDGMLEVNSEWYGKTVYFRTDVNGESNWSNTGTAIDVPAYTELTTDDEGGYIEGGSGTKYKKAITLLNPFTYDTGSKYKEFLEYSLITTNNTNPKGKGWLLDDNGNVTSNHVTVYAVNCETFNSDPQRYMVDAEGNYRVDSVAWGVCTYEEPDISGKAYWVLKDYIANGYGFLAGHDTMYAYAGAYYDAFGVDLDESMIDPNDGTTWYYDINSWMPGTTATSYIRDSSGNITGVAGKSETRGGHFYMNQLMGSNAGNVFSSSIIPSDAPSFILSLGGSHGPRGKYMMYGSENLRIVQTGYSAAEALQNIKYRTPTNYPYSFTEGQIVSSSETHTNQQVAFGTLWVDYYGDNVMVNLGNQEDPISVTIDGQYGTNNFYLSGVGNFLMNQVGHLPENKLSVAEAKLFANSVFYVSQRKQCEICAANQNGQETAHFVHRVNSENAQKILEALQQGGTYWYPLNDCYILVDDIALPEDWKPIANFNGHWDSDVYEVKLNSEGTPLFENTKKGGQDGWNLGTDKSKGTEYVFNENMITTTGVARVVGDLNDLFGTQKNYQGYTVKILGSDNSYYMNADEEFSCTVNADSKYVISNLPCIYDSLSQTGTLRARVYDKRGTEVVEYGHIYVDVNMNFWDDCMTTALYLGALDASPVQDKQTYESSQAIFHAVSVSDGETTVSRWEYRESETDSWKDMALLTDAGNISVTNDKTTVDGEAFTSYYSTLKLNNADPAWDGYEFRCVFECDVYGQWTTYDYYQKWATVSPQPFEGSEHIVVATEGYQGKLTVIPFPQYAQQGEDVTVQVTESATFTSVGHALSNGEIKAEWEFGIFDPSSNSYNWYPVSGSEEFGKSEQIETSVVRENSEAAFIAALGAETEIDESLFYETATFYKATTSLTINKVDLTQDKYQFRVHYIAETPHGIIQEWYSDIADEMNGAWTTENGEFASFVPEKKENYSNILNVIPPELIVVTTPASGFEEGKAHEDKTTPDTYGQWMVLKDEESSVVDGIAAYQVTVYYKIRDSVPQIQWKYRTIQDQNVRDWNTEVAHALGYDGVTVQVTNSTPVQTTYLGEDDWMAFTSTMTIENVPVSMYDTAKTLKYYFRCDATMNYTTVKGTYNLSAADQWGGLGISYMIDIFHNGVIEYGMENDINDQKVTTGQGIIDATTGHEYSVWGFPRLSIQIPEGKYINTVIVSFVSEDSGNASDEILLDNTTLENFGISVQEVSKQFIVLTASEKNTIDKDTWENALRNYITFKTYNSDIDLTLENIATGNVGGTEVKWYIDEAQMNDLIWDEESGHAYKYVDKSTSYSIAQTEAAVIDEETGLSGHLATVSDATENEIIQQILADHTAWLGGEITDHSGGEASPNSLAGPVHWIDGTSSEYVNWSDEHGKAGREYPATANIVMLPDGTWEAYPYADKTTVGNPNAQKTETLSGPTVSYSGYKGNSGWKSKTVNLTETPTGTVTVTATVKHETNGVGDTMFAFEYWNGSKWVTMTTSTNMDPIKDGNYWDYCNYPDYIEIWFRPRTGTFTFTATLPASKTQQFRVIAGNNASRVSYYTRITDMSLEMKYTYDGEETTLVNSGNPEGYIVEYDNAALAMRNASHSAYDDANIGTDIDSVPEINEGEEISVFISGAQKIYDKTQIVPTLVSSGDLKLLKVTYSTSSTTAGYTTKVVNGDKYENTGAVNAATYHVVVELTEEAKAEGYKLSADSQLEADLIIYQRPIHVYSHNNDKIYDGTPNGIINNLMIKEKTGESGVIIGDNILFNTDKLNGIYTTNGAGKTVHNSTTNNNGVEWAMRRNATEELKIVHSESSDPYYNYYIASEDYSGDILQRPVVVHSRYLDDPENPRNIKAYDGTDAAIIKNILIDNVVANDKIGVEQEIMNGTYSSKDAGENLNADGSIKDGRFKNLTEYVITPDTKAVLTGNDYGDYYIEKEEYTGAIYRTPLSAMVKGWRGYYGDKMPERPQANDSYSATNAGNAMSWLILDGLVSTDTITFNEQQSQAFVTEYIALEDMLEGSQKNVNVGNYPITFEALTEENFPILKNYLVNVVDNEIVVQPKEIVIITNDSEKMTGDENPNFFSTFYMRNAEDELIEVGNDTVVNYDEMKLIGDDTVLSVVLARLSGSSETMQLAKTDGVSNIGYRTNCTKDSPAIYLNTTDPTAHSCEWCENYFGFTSGTDHMDITGYSVAVNLANTEGTSLEVAKVVNEAGEEVSNYTLEVIPGMLKVHPELRFQLKATVPMYVCMYGYRGDGNVVEPENYGITNYSNCAVKVTDVTVSEDGWRIVDKEPTELLRGELSMNMNGLQLVNGKNDLSGQAHKWIIGKDESDDGSGQFKLLPLLCYIAGGNVNAADHSFVTKVTYTLAEAYPPNKASDEDVSQDPSDPSDPPESNTLVLYENGEYKNGLTNNWSADKTSGFSSSECVVSDTAREGNIYMDTVTQTPFSFFRFYNSEDLNLSGYDTLKIEAEVTVGKRFSFGAGYYNPEYVPGTSIADPQSKCFVLASYPDIQYTTSPYQVYTLDLSGVEKESLEKARIFFDLESLSSMYETCTSVYISKIWLE